MFFITPHEEAKILTQDALEKYLHQIEFTYVNDKQPAGNPAG